MRGPKAITVYKKWGTYGTHIWVLSDSRIQYKIDRSDSRHLPQTAGVQLSGPWQKFEIAESRG